MSRESNHDTKKPGVAGEIGDRIITAAEHVGGKKALAKKAEVHETQLYRYIRGENTPSVDVAARIAAASGLNLEWLATGRGLPHRLESEPSSDDRDFASDFFYIPLRDLGEYGKTEHPGGTLVDIYAFRRAWVANTLRANMEDLFMARIPGDAMLPTFGDGDPVLIDRRDAHLTKEGVYLLQLEKTVFVRRMQRRIDGRLIWTTDNPNYSGTDVVEVSKEIGVWGRIVWAGRRF